MVLFLLSLPMLNPWVRGDGVGYYAYARAPLIQHNLDFTPDYQHANESFRENRLDKNGQPVPEFRTRTGHLDNHFTVGPAILWSPFLLVAHVGVLLARSLGSAIPADGFSTPYRIAMALATALYGFLGLLISFRLARRYVVEKPSAGTAEPSDRASSTLAWARRRKGDHRMAGPTVKWLSRWPVRVRNSGTGWPFLSRRFSRKLSLAC